MNQEFERMYYESNPSDYNIFRTFILGIINQPMFPRGVIYEGCFDNKPQFFRGESGANDSIIPFCDNILQITESLPINPLTKILRDFRSYRPEAHRKFLDWSEEVAKKVGVLEYAKQDPVSMVRFLQVADQIRAFRHRHWTLTNLYIINFSKHPVATGGSPIVTWLPNQLLTVIDFIKMNGKSIDQSSINSYDSYNLNSILRRAEVDERIIRRETDQKKKIFQEN
jgi:indoleamine 2,3-dioxygenase